MASPTSPLRFAPLFQNHAVLQRDQPIPVWGHAAAGELVTVVFAGYTAETLAGDDGSWNLRLPAVTAGGPHELVATAPSGRVSVNDILVGEVWICSGQSNMEWTLNKSQQTGSAAADLELPQIRVLTVANGATIAPTTGINGQWKVGTADSLQKFSAVGGWFGRKIHRELGVPVGLICNAWGGTRIQAWASRSALVTDPQGAEEIQKFESNAWQKKEGGREAALPFDQWERIGAPQDTGNQGLPLGWATTAFDDSTWHDGPVPARWSGALQPKNGILWFRRSIEIPSDWAGKDLELSLGAIDKHDDTYVNGERVGGMSFENANSWCSPRVYRVPGSLVKAGKLVIAVRARSHVYDGGLTGPASAMRLTRIDNVDSFLPIAGTWKFIVEQNWGSVTPPADTWGPNTPNSPTILFLSRTLPLVPYGIRGVLWYQGESNAHEPVTYRRLMPLMIRDWRHVWGQGNFAFGQVQLANFQPALEMPSDSRWAELRESQSAALSEPATGIAVAIDIGEAGDIHPTNKHDVGLRLAHWALADVYGRGGVPSGPVFTHMEIEAGGRVRCHFKHAENGLVARGGALKRFALAGANHSFEWADAEIDGHTVVVSSKLVKSPIAVRYAWADNPEGCNLYNTEGLPTSPFRSDKFTADPGLAAAV